MSTFFTDIDFFEEISPEALDIGTNYESVGFGSQGEEAGGFFCNEMGGRGAFAGLGPDEIPRAAPSSAPGGLGTQVVRSDNPGSPSDNPLSLHSQLRAPPQMPQLFMMPTNDAAPAAAPTAAPAAAATAAQQHSSSASPPACISISSSPLESPRGLPGSPASAETLRPLQNGRPLVPHPASGLTQDAATTQSTVTNSTSPPQLGGGPVSKTHVIQPRPKPGRKPATEEPESKRKAQNRQSQRNFRERKQKTVSDLQDALGQLNVQLRDERASHVRQINLLENDVKHWKQQAEHWKDEFHRLQHELLTRGNQFAPRTYYINGPQHSTPLRKSFDDSFDAPAAVLSPQPTESGCDRCTSEHCPCIAEMINDRAFQGDASASIDGDAMTGILRGGQGEPENAETEGEKSTDHAEHETDFTFAFRKSKTREANPTEFLSSAEDAKFPDCGFCEGQPESCICKNMRVDAGEETSLLARNTTSSSAEETKPNTAMTGPGSCADCQANPEQRAWCQRVAQLRSEATPPNSRRNSSKSVTLETMEPKASTSIDMNSPVSSPVGTGGTVGCSDAFKLLVGRVNPEMNWRQLKPVLPSFAQQDARRNSFSMEPGMYSAMELDASSILTTLQHAPGPLRPRPSDGNYAQLIQEAEERRRMSFSPMTKPNDHTMLDSST